MRFLRAAFCILSSVSCLLAVDGVVVNGTTGKPQGSVSINLVQPGAGGMQVLGNVTSDAEGKFKIDKDIPPGPALIQATYQGATYTLMLPPGGPTNGVRVNVFNSAANPAAAKVSQRIVLLEPTPTALQVDETVLLQNETNTTFQDPVNGSVQLYLPKEAEGKAEVTINAPGGMPIKRPAEKTKQAGVYKVDFPLRPGETRFDIAYTMPPSDTFSGQLINSGEVTRLVTPPTVTLTGDGVQFLGQEPQTQVHVYGITGPKYEVKIAGSGSIRNAAPAGEQQDEDNGEPKLVAEDARIYTRMWWVLALAFGILGVGGTLLFRRSPVGTR